jgi:tripartite ATP-independent transporter DctP family solute receptor
MEEDMSKRFQKVAGAFACTLMVTGIGSAQAADRTFKIATAVSAGTAQYDGAVRFTELLDKKSGGKLNAKLFGGGTLGKDIAVVSAMQGGTIEMGLMNANLLNGLIPAFAILDFPFAFATEKEAYAVLDGPWGTKLANRLQEKGVVGLGYWELGYLNYHTGPKQIKKLEDIAGMKIRVTETPLQIDFQSAMGANPVPMPFTELYTALESKTVDGGTQPFINLQQSKLYEVQKFVTVTRHMYNPQILLMSKKVWDKLSADEKKVLQEAAFEARDYHRQLSQKRNAEALEFLKTKLTVYVLPPEDIAKMKEKAKPVIDKYTKTFGEPLVKEMFAEIAKVSGGKK